MENHTKRIRKARRQGLARRKDTGAEAPRTSVRRRDSAALEVPGARRPNARRQTVTTNRKTKRQARIATRRMRSPAARGG